jgi:CheY-like chemotaxis protein
VSKHILIVENNPDDAFLIKRAFNTLPFCTSFLCRSAIEAQSYLARAGYYNDVENFPPPDAILTSLRLGADTGFELLDWIRRRESTCDLPIYVFSTVISSQDEAMLRPFRVKAIIEKPTEPKELARTLKAIAEELCGS